MSEINKVCEKTGIDRRVSKVCVPIGLTFCKTGS